ncbi:MAG: RNA chaperone Hfq [Oscillospiraceae bacterium]|jgi:host factor-I protein|nr:RNA chaperone Hfq [Oscillospiraceae bacterium]
MPNTRTHNLQDLFLNSTRGSRQLVTVFLVNGFQMRGTVAGFDSFTVVLDSEGKQQLIYKHAISTIVPTRPVNFFEDPSREDGDPIPPDAPESAGFERESFEI